MAQLSNRKEIPKHWKIRKLGDICEIKGGKNQSNVINPNGKYPIYGSSGIFGYADEYLCDEGTTVIGRKGTINSPIYVKTKFWNVDTAFGLCSKDGLNCKFLYFFCTGFNFHKLDKSTTIPSLAKRDLQSIEIPLPPLPEQQAIVFKIEELLSDLENGKQQLQIAQQKLKIYRQSLLKWAFEGKLTKTLAPWQNVKFDEIAYAIDPQPSHRTPPIAQNGIPFVSIKDFDSEADKIDFTNARRVSPDVLQEHLNRYKLEIGDFVIGKIGTIGKPVRIVLPQNYTLSANIVLIQPRKINATYLYYFFQSSLIEKAFTAGMNATTQAAFGIQKVRELRIELPNKEEQQLIVDELESKLTVCDKIEETISQSLLQAESLRQSILKKAFSGELVQNHVNP